MGERGQQEREGKKEREGGGEGGRGVGNEGCLSNYTFTRLSDLQLIKLCQNLQIIFCPKSNCICRVDTVQF